MNASEYFPVGNIEDYAINYSIIETVKKSGAKYSGPIPMPTEKEVISILRAVHKYKDSREQFEMRTHKRLIDIINPTGKTNILNPTDIIFFLSRIAR